MFTIPFVIMMNFVVIPQQVLYSVATPIVDVVKNTQPKSLLPKIKTYKSISGAKPVTVVSLKCPTESIGISTPTSKLFHQFIDTGMSCINNTNLLPVELQQVCT